MIFDHNIIVTQNKKLAYVYIYLIHLFLDINIININFYLYYIYYIYTLYYIIFIISTLLILYLYYFNIYMELNKIYL